MPAAYREEFRPRAVDLVRENDESVSAVARRLGVFPSGLACWVARPRSTRARVPGLTSEERKELTRLRKENRVLRTGA